MPTHLKVLLLTVPDIQTIAVLARLARELSPVHFYGCEGQGAVHNHDPTPVLPLHYPARARGVDGVGDGAVVGFLVMAIGCEGVGDAGVVGLDQFVRYGIVEALCKARLGGVK
jgi:hypothetical protein